MAEFFGTTYMYPTPSYGMQPIGVCCGLVDTTYIVGFEAPSGGRRRINTPALPPMSDPEKLQTHLDAWAAKRRLQEVK